ncbi:uncharacterized protein LOC134550672 [Prinia subflava]|uniref:uncharacterized protein LOC134550672 n=1 Tax=Prinia subflava TaxID=208062 RepID=UPI002FE30494
MVGVGPRVHSVISRGSPKPTIPRFCDIAASGAVRCLETVPSPSTRPQHGQTLPSTDVCRACGGSSACSSTMAGRGWQWLLRVYVLLMLARPLSPEGHTGTWRQLPEDVEQRDTGPETTPLRVVAAVSLAAFILLLLLMGILLRRRLRRKLQSRWGEEKLQSPAVPAEPFCYGGHGCGQELLEVPRHSPALLGPSLSYSSVQRHSPALLGQSLSYSSLQRHSPALLGPSLSYSSVQRHSPALVGSSLSYSSVQRHSPALMGSSLSYSSVQRHSPALMGSSLSYSSVQRNSPALVGQSLSYSSVQRLREERVASGGLWKRSALCFSAQL